MVGEIDGVGIFAQPGMAGFVGTHFEGGKIAKEFFDDFGVGRCEVGAFSDIAGKIKEGERGRGPISGELPVAFANAHLGFTSDGEDLVGRSGVGAIEEGNEADAIDVGGWSGASRLETGGEDVD